MKGGIKLKYKYKLARKVIKNMYKLQDSVLILHDENNYIVSKIGINALSTSREESIDRCGTILDMMYELLNNPKRFK